MFEKTVKLCRDCKHLTVVGMCHAPKNMKFSYVTGEQSSVQSPQYLREEGGCGYDAAWFEPASVA